MSGLQPGNPAEDPKPTNSPEGPEVNIWDGVSTDTLFLSHDDLALAELEARCNAAGGAMLEDIEIEMILRNFGRSIPYSGEFDFNDDQSKLSQEELYGRNILRKLAKSFAEDGPLVDSSGTLEFRVIGGYLVNKDKQEIYLGVRFKNEAGEFVTPFDLDQSFSSKTFQGYELKLDPENVRDAYKSAVYWMSRTAFEDQMQAFDESRGLLHSFAIGEYKKHLKEKVGFEDFLPEIPVKLLSANVLSGNERIVSFQIGEGEQRVNFSYTHKENPWALTYKLTDPTK